MIACTLCGGPHTADNPCAPVRIDGRHEGWIHRECTRAAVTSWAQADAIARGAYGRERGLSPREAHALACTPSLEAVEGGASEGPGASA